MCGQQPGGVLDDRGRHAEAAVEHLDRGRRACRGGAATTSHESVAHGVVPWAMSPSTVADPVEQRRPTARSCMGERSCASSSTTWPRLGVRVEQVARSRRAGPCRRATSGRRPWCGRASSHSRIALLVGVEAVRRRRRRARRRRTSSRNSTARGSSAGHTDAAYFLTTARAGHGVLHPVVGGVAGPLHLQQHGVREPLGEHLARGVVAHAARRAARRRSRCTSYAGTRHLRAPRGTTRASVGAPTCDQTARRSTSASRASPLSTARRRAVVAADRDRGERGPRSSRGRPRPRRGPAARRRCGRGRRGWGR